MFGAAEKSDRLKLMMTTTTMEKAGEIWSYMSMESRREKSDAIVICCSYDLRVCDHACDLIKAGYADRLVISGKSGNWTKQLWAEPEAQWPEINALVSCPENIVENWRYLIDQGFTYHSLPKREG